MVQGATKRQTQEFRRAFGTDVDAEIQQYMNMLSYYFLFHIFV